MLKTARDSGSREGKGWKNQNQTKPGGGREQKSVRLEPGSPGAPEARRPVEQSSKPSHPGRPAVVPRHRDAASAEGP